MYTLDQVANLFSTSRENARRWCLEFEKYLSEDANPPTPRKRLLNDDDLAVFSLIAEMKGQGRVFADIHDALDAGKRGAVPANPSAVVPADKTKLAKLQADVNRLSEALQLTLDENKGLKGENRALRDELEAARRELKEAYKDIGRLENRIDPSKG
jgi:DNA-binding transcriptional MerR regulator